MANVIENIIRARDEATPTLQRVRTNIQGLRGALGAISPAASGALGPVSGLTGQLTMLGGTAGLVAGVGVAMAGLGVAAVKAATSLSDTVIQLDLLSGRTGVGIEPLQVMRKVIEEAGGNAESLTTALTFLNRAIATNDPLLGKLGITTKDTFAAFMQLADVMGRSGDMAKKTEIAYQLLGRGSADLIALMGTLVSEFRSTEDRMVATGALISNAMTPAARELDNQMDQLSLNWKGFMTRIQAATVPAAIQVVSAFNEIWDAARGAGKAEETFKNLYFLLSGGPLAAALGAGRRKPAPPKGSEDDLQKEVPAPAGTDPLAKVTLGKDAAPTAREKAIERLRVLLGVTRVEAARTLDTLQRIDDEAAALDILRKLSEARGDPELAPGAPSIENQTQIQRQVELNETLQRMTEDAAADRRRAMEEAAAATNFKPVIASWKAVVDEMMTPVALLDQTFGALWNGLQDGFHTVFANMLTGIGTFKNAVTSIFNALVNEIMAMLARLAAARMFALFIKIAASVATGSPAPLFLPGGNMARGGLVDGRAAVPAYALGGLVGETPRASLGGFVRARAMVPAYALGGLVGEMPRASVGGFVRGPGTETSDSVPAMLSRGEFVVRAAAVKQPGVMELLEKLNRGAAPSRSAASAAPAGGFAGGRRERGGNTYIINAISARDAITSIMHGELRRAMDTVATAGEY